MTEGRGHLAENLADIIELIQKRQYDGLLRVGRYDKGQFQAGEVYFQKGQPTYARLGKLSTQEALSQLLGWKQVNFSFVAESPLLLSPPPTPVTPGEMPVLPATPSVFSERLNNERHTPQLPNIDLPPALQPQTDKLPFPSAARGGAMSFTEVEKMVPKRVAVTVDVLSLPLTRPQRSTYLLINGRRSIAELARFTRKSVQEMERLISELEGYGLITL